MSFTDTRTAEVKAMSSVDITGNVVPIEWFSHILLDNGKPDTNSILILSDIVYWYRPKIVRDEYTGKITGYHKRFKSDYLRRSYEQYSNLFGFSEKQIKRCLAFLEESKFIKRIQKRVSTVHGLGGTHLYIKLNVEQLKKVCSSIESLSTPCKTSESTLRDAQQLSESPLKSYHANTVDVPQGTEGRDLKVPSYKGTEITNIDYSSSPNLKSDKSELKIVESKEKDNFFSSELTAIYTADDLMIARLMIQSYQSIISDEQIEINSSLVSMLLTAYKGLLDRDYNTWTAAIKIVANIEVLNGKSKSGFKATIGWLLKKHNLSKVLAGKYFNKTESTSTVVEAVKRNFFNDLEKHSCEKVREFLTLLYNKDDKCGWHVLDCRVSVQNDEIIIATDSSFTYDRLDNCTYKLKQVADAMNLKVSLKKDTSNKNNNSRLNINSTVQGRA